MAPMRATDVLRMLLKGSFGMLEERIGAAVAAGVEVVPEVAQRGVVRIHVGKCATAGGHAATTPRPEWRRGLNHKLRAPNKTLAYPLILRAGARRR